MNWEKAKKSLPFAGQSAFAGSKKTAPCPHCNSRSYGYRGGRYKFCFDCGYSRRMERNFDHVRYLMVRGRGTELTRTQIGEAEEYFMRVYRAAPQ
jgi:hypothetical protein